MDWANNALVGVVAGFVLGLLGSWLLEWRRERRIAGAVRTMIRLELRRNLRALEELWAPVQAIIIEPTEEDGELYDWQPHTRAVAFIERPFPHWDRRAWNGQTVAIPSALTEDEIRRIDSFYANLDALGIIRETLADARRSGVQVFGGAKRDDFSAQVSRLWTATEDLVEEALLQGRQGLT